MPGARPWTAEPPTEAAALAAAGWVRRFMATGPRVEESVALYQALGYDVRLVRPSAAELREECGECRLALELFRVLYTRRPT
jgi:hypothetical protein